MRASVLIGAAALVGAAILLWANRGESPEPEPASEPVAA